MARTLILSLALLAAWTAQAVAGMVTLVFDDGLRGVHQYALPILRPLGLPAVAAVIVERMEADNADYMSVAQVRELQAAGWEIASHGVSHRRITDIPARYAQETVGAVGAVGAVSGWRADPTALGMVQAYTPHQQVACVLQGEARLAPEPSLAQASRRPGSYFFDRITGELHVNPQVAGAGGEIRLCSYEREMAESRQRLEALGLHASSYVVPYNYVNDDVIELGRRYYARMAAGYDGDGLNRGADPHRIVRSVVHAGQPARELVELVEREVRGKDVWLVLCLHDVGSGLGWEPWPAAELKEFAAWLRGNGVDVVTLAQGAERMARGQAKGGR